MNHRRVKLKSMEAALIGGVLLMLVKFFAWFITRSNALLTDAVKSLVNVAVPVGLAVALVPYTIGLVKYNKAQNGLQKAVWLHNRDVLTQHER